jgi:hypothetical protein
MIDPRPVDFSVRAEGLDRRRGHVQAAGGGVIMVESWLRAFVVALAFGIGSGPARAQQALDPGTVMRQALADVAVEVAVPDAGRVQRIFGVPVLDKGIQPVWISIRNTGAEPVWYLPITTDPAYYSALEVAYRFHDALRPEADEERHALFERLQMPLRADPGQTISGFVFTHRETGLKFLTIGLLRADRREEARFVVPVSGPGFAVEQVDFDALYPADKLTTVDLAGLKAALASLPCCAANAEGVARGDPLNIVLVGNRLDVAFPLIQRGWRLTQGLDLRSAVDTAAAFVFHLDDKTSPVSPLYVFGRKEDVAFQKARATINERNHLRLWLTPLRYESQSVWIGQISRDIGVELTTRSWYGTTHKIDAMVDRDRDYLLQDLLMAGAISAFGYVEGVGSSDAANPRTNLEGDPYVTDGRRLVLQTRVPPPFPGPEPVDWSGVPK